ncbi:RNase P and RNase MRP subunit [Pleosporales sp. CAS-2024a]
MPRPQISHDDQEAILDLLCPLIAPLGHHRQAHVPASRGKKRKRTTKQEAADPPPPPPPPPEIGTGILVGINSITRHLETLAARHAPPTAPLGAPTAAEQPFDPNNNNNNNNPHPHPRPLSIVILTHPKPSFSIAHAHLPTLVHLATLAPHRSAPPPHPTRLIPLATSADARLASSLHIPRVGALALFADAPGAQALEAFVRDKVAPTTCRWIDEALAAQWKGINVRQEVSAKQV